jgi:hypothetical protein
MIVAMVTAAAVFGLGMLILPSVEPEPVPVAPPAPPEPPPPPPPPPVAAPDAAADAAVAGAATTGPDAAAAPPPLAEAPAVPAEAPAKAKAEPAAAREKGADKDVAREAWRKNQPDISAEAGKSTIIIPIKGSTEGAIYHVTTKPRNVLVTLPKAESMITMPFYNLKRGGFRQLWIKKDDATAVTTLRLALGDATDPQVEIKDDFVRVTVRRPAEAPADAPAAAPAEPAAAPGGGAAAPSAEPAPAATPAPARD